MKLASVLVVFSLLVLSVFGDDLHITSTDGFIEFANNVNNGVSKYSGTTVYLDTDIDLSGKSFGVIGKDATNYFLGTFNGQGHIISNLKINSESQYAGLFGHSTGLTIKNVVLDESCSVVGSYSDSRYFAYIGGLLGRCYVGSGNCNIENIVNMGNVKSNGGPRNLDLGNIVGSLKISSIYTSTVKNCANYGTVTHSGFVSEYSYIGGIVGRSEGSSSNLVHIQNCLNYGAIPSSGTTNYLYIGGIVGNANTYSKIENCMNGGLVTGKSNTKSFAGGIAGAAYSDSYIYNSFWTSDVGTNKVNGVGYPNIDDESSQITDNSETLKKLNTYSGTYAWNGWILNKNNDSVTFTVNTKGFTLNSQIILLPSLANEGKQFYLWYKDNAYTTPFTETEVESATELYGSYEENKNNYIIKFNTKGGAPVDAITSPFNSVVSLPANPTKEYCTFMYWVNEIWKEVPLDFTVPARNVTLTAVWVCTHIASADDFIEFANNVNSGMSNYSGTTVYLDNNIDFSGKSLDVIGKSYDYFLGTLDGQGHIISNLKINSDSEYVGLFGYSSGLTIKNVVLDDTCSVESSCSRSSNNLGGILGYCESKSGNCTIENIVNMGNVIYNGSNSTNLIFGGIAGSLKSSSSYTFTVKNCVNYGTVTHFKTSASSLIGGIVGFSYDSSSTYVYIQNCLNYGAITGKAESSLYIGGIVGGAYYTKIENCVSGGLITGNSKSDTKIGSIVGYVLSETSISNCFWTSDVGYNNAYGDGSPTIDDESSQVTLDSTLKNKLNTYSSTNGLSNWAMLYLNGGKINNINQEYFVVNNKYFPDPEKVGYTFKGWFTDSACTNPFDNSVITKDTTLYAKYDVELVIDSSSGSNGSNEKKESSDTKESGSESKERGSENSSVHSSSVDVTPISMFVSFLLSI